MQLSLNSLFKTKVNYKKFSKVLGYGNWRDDHGVKLLFKVCKVYKVCNVYGCMYSGGGSWG
jgi:hypothetical protein